MSRCSTSWNSISTIMPIAPRETSAARKRSGDCEGEHFITWPLASTMRKLHTESERRPWSIELPCVAVPMAPASDCTSMEPSVGIVRPWSFAARFIACIRMPACTVILISCSSRFKMFPKSSRFTIHADVQVRSEGECPLPTVTTRRRIRRASVTIFCISGMDCGRMYSSGREWKVRAHV